MFNNTRLADFKHCYLLVKFVSYEKSVVNIVPESFSGERHSPVIFLITFYWKPFKVTLRSGILVGVILSNVVAPFKFVFVISKKMRSQKNP